MRYGLQGSRFGLLVVILALLGGAAPLGGVRAETKAGEWGVQCQGGDGKQPPCVAVHEIVINTGPEGKGGKGRVLRVSLFRNPQKTLFLHALLPLGIWLPSGVASTVDNAPQAPMLLQRCTQLGCEAVLPLSEQAVATMTAGKELKVGFKSQAEGQTVVVVVSLAGVAGALAQVR